MAIDAVVPSDSNIRKKEYKKLENYQSRKEELERKWKAKVVPGVVGALGTENPKWLQKNNTRMTSELSV